MSKQEEELTQFCVYLGNDKEWRVTADSFQFILAKKCVPKEKGKKNYYRVEGYYTNVRNLLESLVNKKLRNSDITTIKAMQKELKAIHEELEPYSKVIIG